MGDAIQDDEEMKIVLAEEDQVEEANEEMNEEDNNEENSFFPDDDDNINAMSRENAVDTEALSVNPELLGELRDLKRSLYNAVVFAPPVGSEDAQDLQTLQVYESLLIELNNLLASIFDDENQTTQFAAQQFTRFPEQVREPARAYCMKIMDFKNSNTKPYLNDILVDHFDRILKEHPY